MIDSGLPLLTLNTGSSYHESLYFFSHLKNILREIECSSQICAWDLSPLRYPLTTLSLNSGGYTFLFCIRITPLNEFYHSLNSHPNVSWYEYVKNCSAQKYIKVYVLVTTMLLNRDTHFSKISYVPSVVSRNSVTYRNTSMAGCTSTTYSKT